MDKETRKIILQFFHAFKFYQARTEGMEKLFGYMIPKYPKGEQALFEGMKKDCQQLDEKTQTAIAQLEHALLQIDKDALLKFKEVMTWGKPNNLSDFLDALMRKILARIPEFGKSS